MKIFILHIALLIMIIGCMPPALQGPAGPKGDIGKTGPKGDTGKQGNDGRGLTEVQLKRVSKLLDQDSEYIVGSASYNFGFALAGSQTGYNYLEDYVWLPAGTKISSDSYDVQRIVIKLFSSSLYSPKIITQESTVPNGKIWKVSNVLLKEFINLEKTSFVGNNYAVEIKINDKVHIIGEWGSPSSTTEQMFQSNLKNEIWLPAGTKLSLNRNIIGYSILEYSQGSTGTGSNSSGSSSNSASSNTLIYTTQGF